MASVVNSTTYLFCSAICLLLLTMSLRAQEYKLQAIIDEGQTERGTGNRLGSVDLDTTSSAHSVIPASRFRHTFTDLPKVLQHEVGVQTRSTGGAGSLASIVLRGASSEQVVVYLDGIPLNDASGNLIDINMIPVSIIDRIEIFRGSTPSELGNPSIGGAVNIITRQSDNALDDETASIQLSASVASFATYKASVHNSVRVDRHALVFNAAYLTSENDFNFVNDNGTQFNLSDDTKERRNNDAVKQASLLFSWKYAINKKYDTDLKIDFFDRDKEIPSLSNSDAVQTQLDTQRINAFLQINAKQVLFKNANFNARLYASQKNETFDDLLAQLGFLNQQTESTTDKRGMQLYYEINNAASLWKLRSTVERETFDRESSLALVESDTSVREYKELTAELVNYFDDYRFITNFILRYHYVVDQIGTAINEFGAVTSGFNKTYELLNPQLGAKYRFDKNTYITANIGKYNRAPNFIELFGGDGLLVGNVDLLQETSLNIDAGLTYNWYEPYSWLHDAEFYGGVFYNSIDDLIVRIYNGRGVGVAENISDAIIKGIELKFKLKPAESHVLHANVSLIDSENQSTITGFNGNRLPGYYQTSLAMSYIYSDQLWHYAIEADFKRDMFYDRGNLLPGDDANLINLVVRRQLKQADVDLRLNNILDEDIRYFRNRPTPGFNVAITYNHYL